MPEISIIVPVYNVEQYVEKCVRTILAQTFTDFELILVDDGGTDRSGEICDTLAKEDRRITVYHKQNGGLSDARNYGIDRAKGNFLTFIDSDDYIKETYLEYLYSLLKEKKGCKVSACNHFVVRGDKQTPNCDENGTVIFDRQSAFRSVLYHNTLDVSAWAKLYSRDIFETLRYPKGRLYEDTYVFGDVLNGTEYIVYGGQPQYYYVQRENSIVNSGFNEKHLQFIDSAKRLCDFASHYEGNEKACKRRMTHAYLSVLRNMENCKNEKRKALRKEVLKNKSVLFDKDAPGRDKLAILTLMLGFGCFYTAWRVYGISRS